MYADQAYELCSRLLEETRAEIRRDRESKATSVHVAKLLEKIEEDLEDPDLSVTELRRRCGIRDKNVSTLFARDVGIGPDKYIFGRRMETAAKALEASTLEVWKIGVQVGYLTPNSFTRAFGTWCGKSPEEFREEAATKKGAPPAAPPTIAVSREQIERAVTGELPADDAEALVAALGELRDRISDNYSDQIPPSSDRILSEQAMAAYVWRCIEHEPPEIQQAAVASQAAAFHTPALFLLLSTASVEAAYAEPERAIRLAELAHVSLRAIEDRLGDAAPPYQVRAHAVTGHALSSAGRQLDAGRAFIEALELLETMDEPSIVVLAELYLYLGLFDAAQGNVDRALEKLEVHDLLMHHLVGWVEEMNADDGE